MTARRERPSDAEVEGWVIASRSSVLAHANTRRWRRRLSRPMVIGSVVGAVAAGGIAYAAVERTRIPDAPPTVRGNSFIEIGAPHPEDRWLNLSISYRCKPGERFELKDGDQRVAWADCDQQSFRDPKDPAKLVPGPGGLAKSIPVEDVVSTRLTMISTLTDAAVVDAEFGRTSAMSMPEILPPNGTDGLPAWDLPSYPVNEFGLTVGSRITVNTPYSAWPDLIPTTYRGQVAYFRADDNRLMPGNPKEAVRMMKERERLGLDVEGKIYRFVYAADGKTRLGKVFVGTSRSR